MAAALNGAERVNLPDYSTSHRPPPPIPTAALSSPNPSLSAATTTTTTTTSTKTRLRAHSHSAGTARLQKKHGGPAARANGAARGGDVASAGDDGLTSRRGSLPFLHRTASAGKHSSPSTHSSTAAAPAPDSPPVPPLPQLPNTRISHAHADAASRRSRSHSRTEDVQGSGEAAFAMLRKVSRSRQDKDRQLRDAAAAQAAAAAAPRPPPSLPLPSFTEESSAAENRDSVAIFNSVYANPSNPSNPSQSPQPRPTANFSRPAMPLGNSNPSSSSPAYAARPVDAAGYSSSPSVAAPRGNGEYVVEDRTQSMTNRGRYSYASSVGQVNSVNSPRRVRRRKDPTPFNVMVIGAKNSGKTSFISFLRQSLALPAHKHLPEYQPEPKVGGNRSSFRSDYLETEIDGERVGVTLWDSMGLEKNMVDLQLREMAAFVEAKFEDTFVEEQKVMRSPGVKDTHIHCVFLILDPARLDTTIAESTAFHKNGSHAKSLDEHLDLQVMRALWGKTTVIPIISKADTLTFNHMKFLKRAVWEALKGANLNPLEALELEEDEDEDEVDAEYSSDEAARSRKAHKRHSSVSALTADDEAPYLPMSILSPDLHDLPPYVPASRAAKPERVGRKFPWGFADPHDPEHCDFGRFRDSIFSEWRADLRELSRTKWYENWRTSRLQKLPGARQRIKGGVTPAAAVPTEGRSASATRQFSSPPLAAPLPADSSLAANGSVPRSASGQPAFTALPSVPNGQGARDFARSGPNPGSHGGVYREVDSYK